MELKSLHIFKNYEGSDYHGSADFENESSKISLKLEPELCNSILLVIENRMDYKSTVRELVREMCIRPALEHKEE